MNFLHGFSKNTQISNFIKIRLVGAEFFHADGRTDMPKLIGAFRSFGNAPKKDLELKIPKENKITGEIKVKFGKQMTTKTKLRLRDVT
jgi:hypothetical protein